jgi:hypothetical protein
MHDITTPRRQAVECQSEWHYGTLGPRRHNDPTGPQGWNGIHGVPTLNPSGFCDECEADWRANYPTRPLVLRWKADSSNAALRYAADPCNWDGEHDPWGSGMAALGAVCDVLYAMGESHLIEPSAGYRPAMGQSADLAALADADPEDEMWDTVALAQAVRSGDVNADDLARASRILSLYLDLARDAGRDY